MTSSSLRPRCLAVLTSRLQRVKTLSALLNDVDLRMSRKPDIQGLDGVLAWGRKPSARIAEAFAARHGLPLWRAEDGFLRSVRLGNEDPPLSIVLDDLGIYYDATCASRLEALIGRIHRQDELMRAAALRASWCEGRLSKYNYAREASPPLDEPFTLVVDQTSGDASITYGCACATSFTRMLEAALDEHPGSPVLLKVHPDVIAGRKRGHFDTLTPGQAARVRVLITDVHPCSLLEAAHIVYTVTSQMGFEALLWGKPVRCFGMPFYAGWGLTSDELCPPARRRPVGLDDLVHAALIEYPRYLDPETGQRCEPERLIEWMALQRRMRERFPARVYALAFSRWKKPIVRAFFSGSEVLFVRKATQVPPRATLAIWGRGDLDALESAQAARSVDNSPATVRPSSEGSSSKAVALVRLEDGFLRSVGLGADLVRPISWVMDRTGIYYDATRPSDLETLLQTATFDEALRKRARALRERIVASGVTKYNVGVGKWRRPNGVNRVVLVPGQVESDASIAFGAPGLRTNIELLRTARRVAPNAYLVYKPHPDVVAGLRKQGQSESEAKHVCDEVVVDVPMYELLEKVDEVHVLTSLAGFEALLRGKPVRCEGLPFYAGWGLTEDSHRCARRTRRLDLDELVAGALILYPTYVSRTTGAFTTPERALDELIEWRSESVSTAQKLLNWVIRIIATLSRRNHDV